MKTVDFLFGRVKLYVPSPTPASVIFDILRRSGAGYESLSLFGNGVCFVCGQRDAKRLQSIFLAKDIDFEIQEASGLFVLLSKTKHRLGLYLGCLLFLFTLVFSTQFVFDIQISGNEILTRQQVLAELAAQGFSYGSQHTKIDIEALCNRIVLHSESISWISVNMLGTIAHVEIKERQDKPTPEEENPLSCLVATRDGVIVGFDCTTGKIEVGIGETVKEGQLLVNGVIDTALGTYYGNAAGAVRARTNRIITVEIPKNESVVVGYTRSKIKKEIIFLGKTIKVFAKGGNLPPSCDTMSTEIHQLSLSASHLLPLFVKTTYQTSEIRQQVNRTSEEALRLANEEYVRIKGQIPDLVVLSEKTTFTETETAYVMTKTISCIENIAKKVPIQTN